MKTPVRRRLAALAMVLLVPTVGGCSFGGFMGGEYQTDQVYQAGLGVNDHSGTVDVLAAVVVSGTDGTGTFVASLVNKSLEEPATLTGVTGADGLEVQLTAPIEIGPETLVNLADLGAVSVKGDAVEPGGFVRLTLAFDNGEKSDLNVPVVNRDAEFSQVKPVVPSASPSS